jgi:uncharacterized protein YidB (DUF937 family)
MGLIDMLGSALGRAPKSGDPIMDALLPMLNGKGTVDGLGGLLGRFTGAGLGAKVNSWVGTGENEPLGADEVEQALGADEVGRIAREAGVSPAAATSGLASMIPGFVDQMSPGGTLLTGADARSMKGLDFTAIVGR